MLLHAGQRSWECQCCSPHPVPSFIPWGSTRWNTKEGSVGLTVALQYLWSMTLVMLRRQPLITPPEARVSLLMLLWTLCRTWVINSVMISSSHLPTIAACSSCVNVCVFFHFILMITLELWTITNPVYRPGDWSTEGSGTWLRAQGISRRVGICTGEV